MNPARIYLTSATLVLTTMTTESLYAQTDDGAPTGVQTKDSEGGYIYEFEDDPLDASPESAQGARIRVIRGRARTLLLRPRTQFIREIFQSAENL